VDALCRHAPPGDPLLRARPCDERDLPHHAVPSIFLQQPNPHPFAYTIMPTGPATMAGNDHDT
jgi:hypothetical protein